MKTLFIGILSGVCMISSYALAGYSFMGGDACAKPSQKYSCQDVKESNGFKVEFTVYSQKPWGQKISVTLQKKTGKSHELVAELPCFRKAPEKRAPDKVVSEVECYDPMEVDTGFRVTQTTPDFAGVTWATVSQISIAGAQEVAKIPCKKK